jgi:hypothetical protein
VAIPGIGGGSVRRRQVGIRPSMHAGRTVNIKQKAETHSRWIGLYIPAQKGGAYLAWPCTVFVNVSAIRSMSQALDIEQAELYSLHMPVGKKLFHWLDAIGIRRAKLQQRQEPSLRAHFQTVVAPCFLSASYR